MPGRRDPPPVLRDHPCGAVSPGGPPSLAESACALSETSLSESAGDVVFRPFVGRIGKYFFSSIELDHLAQQEKPGELRHPGRLLHIMRDNHDRVLLF